jgi:L-glyceraldehyde 3-phosphate reductase
MGLEYVDVFYHHRPDDETPMEESMFALDQAVRLGKALYVGLSNYGPDQTRRAVGILKSMGTPYVLHQPKYSMFDRWIEDGLLEVLDECGMGCIVFSPLAQGMLSDKYLSGIPETSRAANEHGFLQRRSVTEERIEKARRLNEIAVDRGQTLAQMAIAWVLRHPQVTSALIGASSVGQITENVETLKNLPFSVEELNAIEAILGT